MYGLPKSTPSLRLRHFVQEDALQVMTLNAEPSTSLWLPSHVYETKEEAESRLGHLISCYKKPGSPQLGPYVLGVVEAATSQLLGHVGFSPLDGEVEVSYAMAEAARGQGFGTEALIHGCEWIVAAFGLRRVVALTAAANIASRRTLERAFFTYEHDSERSFQGVPTMVSRYVWQVAIRGD